MNQRERVLAIVVGLLMAGAVLYYGGKRVASVFTARADRIQELNEEISAKELQQARGMRARRLLDAYSERAMPSDEVLANSRYRAWLHEWAESADIRDADVKWVTKQTITLDKERIHDIHQFSVVCHGDLPQLVQLLYDFYRQDYLHRVKLLHARPLKDKRLSMKFTIEAVSMPGVDDKELSQMPSARLAHDTLEDYFNVIVRRNIYAPANLPPQFADEGPQRGYVNQPMSFAPDVKDPEEGELTFRVQANGLPGLNIDEQTGEIEWVPNETGEFEILVYATDNGIPAKESAQTIRLAVSQPPPPPPREEPPPRRTFDEAKYTFVTGIVEVNGRRQVWLTVRTDGTWLRLFEGDTFEVGAMSGEIVRILPRQVEIVSGDAVISVRFGESLYEGQVVRDPEEGVAARQD